MVSSFSRPECGRRAAPASPPLPQVLCGPARFPHFHGFQQLAACSPSPLFSNSHPRLVSFSASASARLHQRTRICIFSVTFLISGKKAEAGRRRRLLVVLRTRREPQAAFTASIFTPRPRKANQVVSFGRSSCSGASVSSSCGEPAPDWLCRGLLAAIFLSRSKWSAVTASTKAFHRVLAAATSC